MFSKKFMVNQLFVLYELGFSPLNLIIVKYKDFIKAVEKFKIVTVIMEHASKDFEGILN